MRPMPTAWFPAIKSLCIAVATVLLLAGLFRSYCHNQSEDFMYYYCAGWVHQRGESIYDPAKFQGCIESLLGHQNPNLATRVGSAYPPTALVLFTPLARFPFWQAFVIWTLALALGALLLFQRFEREPWSILLILCHPAFILSIAYHKLSLLLIPCLLWGVEWLRRGRDAWGGALIGVLSLQPQYFLAVLLLLALQRRWQAALWALLSAGAIALAATGGDVSIWRQWAVSAAQHAQQFITIDNQSLFVALYKPVLHWNLSMPVINAVRLGLAIMILAAAVWSCRRRPIDKVLGLWLALTVLAQPYSHGSDFLWALPLYFETLGAVQERLKWSRLAIVIAALALSVILAAAFGFYHPHHFPKLSYQYRQGFLTLGLVLVAAAIHLFRPFFGARSGSLLGDLE